MPSIANITTSTVLTTIMEGRVMQGFSAEKFMPSTLVNKRFGKIYSAGQESLRQTSDQMKSGVMSNRVDWDYSSSTYTTEKRGLHASLDADLLDNADQPINLRADATNLLSGIILLGHEVRAATMAGNTTVITQTAAATAAWDAASGQDPRLDIDTGKEAIRTATGRYPTHMITPPACRNALVAYLLSQAQVTYGELSQVVDLPATVQGLIPIVPMVVKDTANLGQDASLSEVYDATKVTLCIVDSPSTLYSGAFLNVRRTKIGPSGFRVRQWYDEATESEFVECQVEEDELTIGATSAYIITTVTT